MQQMGDGAHFRDGTLDQIESLGEQRGLPRVEAGARGVKLVQIDFEGDQILAHAVVQFAGNFAAFGVLQLQNTGAESA